MSEIQPTENSIDAHGLVDGLEGLNQPSTDFIRAIRLKLLDQSRAELTQGQQISGRLIERLEREPIVRDPDSRANFTYSDHDLSRFQLFDGNRYLATNSPFFNETNHSSSSFELHHRLALRLAMRRAEFPPAARRELLMALGRLADMRKCLREVASYLGTHSTYDFKRRHTVRLVECVLATHGLSDQEVTMRAERFVKSFCDQVKKYKQKPTFVNRSNVKLKLQIEPKFHKFFLTLGAESDLTGFIERQKLVKRPAGFTVALTESIYQLGHISYDVTKVRQFSLVAADGSRLHVVSKRLSPIKSASAEDEYNNSRYAFENGIPTPEPIGIIEDKGNVYFIWKRIMPVASVPESEWPEMKRQRDDILSGLSKLGLLIGDAADRNFLVERKGTSYKVYILDFERCKRVSKLGEPDHLS